MEPHHGRERIGKLGDHGRARSHDLSRRSLSHGGVAGGGEDNPSQILPGRPFGRHRTKGEVFEVETADDHQAGGELLYKDRAEGFKGGIEGGAHRPDKETVGMQNGPGYLFAIGHLGVHQKIPSRFVSVTRRWRPGDGPS